jgi:hypothetical protein
VADRERPGNGMTEVETGTGSGGTEPESLCSETAR